MIALYEEIVGRGGVSPAYFFDKMDYAECAVFLRGMQRKERAELERARLIMWSVFQSQSRRKISLDDVLKLESEKEKTVKVNKQEMDDLRKRIKNFKP